MAIYGQLLARLEQSSSSRCNKVACRGSRIGRDLFSSRIVDFLVFQLAASLMEPPGAKVSYMLAASWSLVLAD
jgi:hypothetical protein